MEGFQDTKTRCAAERTEEMGEVADGSTALMLCSGTREQKGFPTRMRPDSSSRCLESPESSMRSSSEERKVIWISRSKDTPRKEESKSLAFEGESFRKGLQRG